MHNLFRLIAALLFLGVVLVPGQAKADYPTLTEAYAACNAVTNAGASFWWYGGTQTTWISSAPYGRCVQSPYNPLAITSLRCNGPCDAWSTYTATATCPASGTWNDTTHTCPATAPTAAQCLARNKPDPGDPDGRGAANRYYIVGTAPTSYCNSGCDLAVGAAIRTFSGVNPTTGAPVQWGEHEQTYAGTTCSAPVILDQDANPTNSMTNPATTPTTTDWSCNYAAGTCVDPTGNINYCVFAGAGTAASPYTRSSCVPASGDSDGDGVPNDRDTAPNDPLNGKDTTGTESDNVSSGGGSCASPPVSSGDGIASQIAYQTWATRCAVEALKAQVVANNASGGALNPADSAKLSAIVNAQTLTNSKLDGIAGNTGATASAAAATAQGVDAMKKILNGTETGPHPDTGAVPTSGSFFVEHEVGDTLDMSGITGPGQCPTIPDVQVLQQVVHIDITTFCEWIKLGGLLVVLSAIIASLRILGT